MKKSSVLALVALVVVAGVIFALRKRAAATKDSGGKIVIGVPNWPSAKAKSYILKFIIEENFGLEVELQNGSNAVIFEAMDKGAMHIHPETWSPNHNGWIKKYAEQTQTIRESTAPRGVSKQNICVTLGTLERTGIQRLEQLTDLGMARNFDTDGDGKGEIWIGAPGWGSTSVERIRAKSYGYDATMKLKMMDEALAMVELDAAIAKQQNIVFFCYSPHHMFQLYPLQRLEEPPHDPEQWRVIPSSEDPDWLEKSHAAVAWPDAYTSIHYSTTLEQSHPQVAQLFSRVGFSSDDSSDMGYQLVVKKVSAEQYARQWVDQNTSLVDSWLR